MYVFQSQKKYKQKKENVVFQLVCVVTERNIYKLYGLILSSVYLICYHGCRL